MAHEHQMLELGKQIESLLQQYSDLCVSYVSGAHETVDKYDRDNVIAGKNERKAEREKLWHMFVKQRSELIKMRDRQHRIIIQHAKYTDKKV